MSPKTATNTLKDRICNANDAIYQAMQAACDEPGREGRTTYRLLHAAELASRTAFLIQRDGLTRYEFDYLSEKLARIQEDLAAIYHEIEDLA